MLSLSRRWFNAVNFDQLLKWVVVVMWWWKKMKNERWGVDVERGWKACWIQPNGIIEVCAHPTNLRSQTKPCFLFLGDMYSNIGLEFRMHIKFLRRSQSQLQALKHGSRQLSRLHKSTVSVLWICPSSRDHYCMHQTTAISQIRGHPCWSYGRSWLFQLELKSVLISCAML
jgi:hypothetical protein